MSNVATAIQEFEGHTPRVIADLTSVSWEIEFIREDIQGQYSEDELDEAYQLIMANHVTGDDFKKLIDNGQFNAQISFLGDVLICFFPSKRYEGVFVSFDYSEEFPVTELVKQVSESRADAS